MNKTKRLISQAIFWLLVWLTLWLNQQSESNFISANYLVYAMQIILISGLIFFAAPKLLFKKKYFYFSVFSIIIVCVFAYFASNAFSRPQPPMRPPHIERPNTPPPHLEPNRTPKRFEEGINQNRRPNPVPQFFINILLMSLSYILAALIETFLFIKKKEEEAILAKNENLQNELKFLKSQINPHFLFNSLNNIYALAGIDSERTQQSISYLSEMLRYVLYECEQEFVPLKKELEYIENYLNLYALKSSKKYPITTEFNIFNNTISIAPMILIPFIENALKHSDIEKINESYIAIKVNSDKNHIHFKVENSKPKSIINKDQVGGIGLENVKKRLAILYPEKHELNISENKSTFKVQLTIHLE